MNSCLKIGDRLLTGDQIISALVQYKLLEMLVGHVLLDDAIKETLLTKQELFRVLAGATDAPIPDDLESFAFQWCQAKGVTPEYFNSVILRELRVQKFKQINFADHVESEFLRVKSDLDQVEYSLIQTNDLSLAQELYFQLRDDGADFFQLAQKYSLGSERQTGGRVGPVSMSSLPKDVIALFSNEQVGVVYGPIPLDELFWIVRLEQFAAARLNEATRASLINRMHSQWLQSQVRQMVDSPGMIAVQTQGAEQNDAV